jgi:hypothetical protein
MADENIAGERIAGGSVSALGGELAWDIACPWFKKNAARRHGRAAGSFGIRL